ncbi:MAG: DUF1385 domain-containing protein [Desulfovibrionales bacterium]
MSEITIGGQAVLEGVMMRSKDSLAIAVRRPSGEIVVERRPWFVLGRWKFLRIPFVRGFPVLLETLVNGIKALNFSAQQALEEEEEEISSTALVLTLAVSILLALTIFVGLPHFLSVGMQSLGLGGGIEDLSFHLWDGLFRVVMFLGYIVSISFLPDIRRVFQYHGAEHKVIHAYEAMALLSPAEAKQYSRLHPRCGTAFLLFVLSISIILFTFLVPVLVGVYSPSHFILKHGYILLIKFILMVPISGISYELIKVSGKIRMPLLHAFLCSPGLLLQMLTTKEPDEQQLEVAIQALKGAVGAEDTDVCKA